MPAIKLIKWNLLRLLPSSSFTIFQFDKQLTLPVVLTPVVPMKYPQSTKVQKTQEETMHTVIFDCKYFNFLSLPINFELILTGEFNGTLCDYFIQLALMCTNLRNYPEA